MRCLVLMDSGRVFYTRYRIAAGSGDRYGDCCMPVRSRLLAAFVIVFFPACDGPLSALSPAGLEAERIARLFWWMSGAGAIIWLAVVGLAIYAIRPERERHTLRGARTLIVVGGFVFPTVALAGLLSYSLAMLPDFLAPVPPGSLRVSVVGEQWWWRVRYHHPSRGVVDLANEIRLPAGEPVEFQLESRDVIHSFWIPSLAGKSDMIPGRRTRLRIEPLRTGVFKGVCAEYCGTSHALMGFPVVVLEKEEFESWLDRESEPAAMSDAPLAAWGRELFDTSGCGACHTVRGTNADGFLGPDLTHVGSRLRLGADLLPNTLEDFELWISRTEELKPSVHMPPFGMLPPSELTALAAYLGSLK
jgi:cytochrome c oxidase subunit II